MGDRLHIVLIPGFAGFDALGQLEYYAGVTPLFRRWSTGTNAVLHYFDNFPTAGVATRAGRLSRYLMKRIARGEFCPGDSVALVGHSTGGLDIRRLLWDLTADPKATVLVDGTMPVSSGELLALIRNVAFLSVPQWGTNIAHWVRENLLTTKLIVAELRGAVAASQAPVIHRLQGWLTRLTAHTLDVDLLHALEDSLREAETGRSTDPSALADAQEAESNLALWLRHMSWDFSAIEDLTPPLEGTGPFSPAHFTAETRRDETARWEAAGICTHSWATVGPRPFDFRTGEPAPDWHLANPLTWPDFTPRSGCSGTDSAYRYCYRACAGGPLRAPKQLPHDLEVWDNDGIVNTVSMLWPNGEDTEIVHGDHMDIAGHFSRVKGEGPDREFRAYDLLASGAGFGPKEFEAVWNSVFAFCASSARPRSRTAAGPGAQSARPRARRASLP